MTTITLDKSTSIRMYSPVCGLCKHFRAMSRLEGNFLAGESPNPKCDAFPDGIPLEIWDGKNKHTDPVDGDHGIQFERGKPQGV